VRGLKMLWRISKIMSKHLPLRGPEAAKNAIKELEKLKKEVPSKCEVHAWITRMSCKEFIDRVIELLQEIAEAKSFSTVNEKWGMLEDILGRACLWTLADVNMM